jgi:hypothetical protein
LATATRWGILWLDAPLSQRTGVGGVTLSKDCDILTGSVASKDEMIMKNAAKFCAAIVVMFSLTAMAQEQSTDAETAKAAANAKVQTSETLTERQKDPNRRICKEVAPTGTRIAKRTCLTAAQWEEAARVAREGTEKTQSNQRFNNPRPN